MAAEVGGGAKAAEASEAVPGTGMWPLTDDSRSKIVDRLANNLAAISFFSSTEAAIKGVPDKTERLNDEAAREHALVIEREAFTFADAKFKDKSAEAMTEGAAVLSYAQHASDAMLTLLKAKVITPSLAAAAGFKAESSSSSDRAPPVKKAEAESVSGVDLVELDLSKSGTRDFVETEQQAAEFLKPMLDSNPNNHVRVKLSTKCFKPGSCGTVVKALRNAASTLKHADLSDIIAGQPEAEALAVLAEIAGALADIPLLTLNLSNNALGEKGIRAFASALSAQRGLESLSFCNIGCSAEAAAAIVELLPKDCAATLKTLHFHNNCTGDEGAIAISELVRAAASSRLSDFRHSSTRVEEDGGKALAQALGAGSSLRKLDLRDNMFGEAGGAELAEALKNHSGLTELYLADTGIGLEGACMVLDSISVHCREIRVLDLGGNELLEEGAKKLASCLASLPVLKKLVLNDNELKDEGASAIARGVADSSKELEVLDLCTNEITDSGALAAADAACKLPMLQKLLLNGNCISKAGIANIKDVLVRESSQGLDVLGPLDENDDGEGGED